MTTKKVGANDELHSSLIRQLAGGNLANTKRKSDTGIADAFDALSQSEGKIDIGLASAINSQFNPATLESDRRAKVEELKKLIQSGQYKPSAEDVAQAVSSELALEILSYGPTEKINFGEEEI